MGIRVNIAKAEDLVIRAIKAQVMPMLSGSPAMGKSALVHQIAKQFNLKVIDLRLAQCDPTDLMGFPHINKETGKASYMPMDTFPIEGDEIPEGMNGWLLFLDEFNHADRSVQKAAYKLVLDRKVGNHNLHKNVAVVAAGNLDTDGAMVEDMSTAMQSRLIHLELDVDVELWLDWALANGIDHRITSYVKYKPENLYNFSPEHQDKTYPSPRTWEFLSRLIIGEQQLDVGLLPLMAGTISEGTAREFLGFTKIYKDLLTMEQILANPETVPVPSEPSVLFALTGSISQNISESNATDLMKFVNRLPIEFQVITLRGVSRRVPKLIKQEAILNWVKRNGTELFN